MSDKKEFGSEVLWQLMDGMGICMLTTRDGDVLRSRPMSLIAKKGEDCVWMFFHADDHLNDEIKSQPKVGLSFMDKGNQVYASASGTAEQVHDPDKVDELWSPSVAAWYKDGRKDENIRLMRITLSQGEIWDAEAQEMKRLWEMAKAAVSDREAKLTDKKKVNLG